MMSSQRKAVCQSGKRQQWRQEKLPYSKETVSFLETVVLFISTEKSPLTEKPRALGVVCVLQEFYFFGQNKAPLKVKSLTTNSTLQLKKQTFKLYWHKLISSLDAIRNFGSFRLVLWFDFKFSSKRMQIVKKCTTGSPTRRTFFGQPYTAYDFAANDMEDIKCWE